MINCLNKVPLVLSAFMIAHAPIARANELESQFYDSVVFTNVGYSSGSNVISNFPLRVDISTTRPNGFDYDLAGVKAADIRFNWSISEYTVGGVSTNMDETVNFVVSNWNEKATSTIYVQLPRFNNSTKAKLTMYWNPVDYPDLPENRPGAVPFPVVSEARSPAWNKAIQDQSTNENYIACGPAYRRIKKGETWVKKYLNYWLEEPTISKTTWKQGDKVATITTGSSKSGGPVESIEYFDRNTSSSLGDTQPLTPGSYRVVVTVAETDDYASLAKSLDFNIETSIVIGGIVTTNDFANRVTFSLTDDIGDDSLAALAGKPFLVKLSDNSPKGFYFENLIFGATPEGFYSDVRFFSEKGEPLDYTIAKWDTVEETYVWVNVPEYSEKSRITMCWGQRAGADLPENDPDAVWAEGTTDEAKEEWLQYYLDRYEVMVKSGRVTEDGDKQLQNRWTVEPSISKTQWLPGESAPTVNAGRTCGGNAKAYYYDRSTGATLSSLPVDKVGEYRVIFRFDATESWSALEKSVNFRIVKTVDTHELGYANARVLLANNDTSVAGGEMYTQSYDDNEDGWGVPYWTHHEYGSTDDVSDFDATKLSAAYNLFPGTCHEYLYGGERLWGLENVRFGNLFNNGRFHPGERGAAGLRPEQNYLPWNPLSERMLGATGLQVGEYHRYAGTFLLQNVCNTNLQRYAQICSPCYDEGIGTIYFDVVNAFTNNVRDADGKANYAIVVEIATNVTGRIRTPPVDGIWPDGIASGDEEGNIFDPYFYADWHAIEMIPVRFKADTGVDVVDCERLPPTKELELDLTGGGSVTNFYRVYAPVDIEGQVRFRIRRSRIDRTASFNPDADAYIILDNLICSRAKEAVQLVPYGWYDEAKRGKQYLGREMAFTPSFPGINDAVYGRVKALDVRGDEIASGDVTAVTMHYRWKYLNQAKTDWLLSDFNPTTLESIAPLTLPAGLPGDIEFWFEGSQNCGYYNYANYSGTKLGIPGYSESFSLMTNGWDGASAEWSVRIREGRSDYEAAVLAVRDPKSGAVTEREMFLVEDHQWRGYYQTRELIADGMDFRIEFRNREPDGTKEWDPNTNRVCLATVGELPYAGRMQSCGEDGWMRIPVEAITGYLMFQADDSTMGLSIVRADYQDFNRWTDGYGDVFVGSAADDSNLPASGVSPLTRDFDVRYDALTNSVSLATNALWTLDFETQSGYEYDKMFAAGTKTVNGWKLGKGKFVYGAYRDPAKGTAFQMAGCGEGYVEMSDRALGLWPRGVEKVTFSASIAQSIDFGDFSYLDEAASKTNYCFRALGAFDLAANESFTGDASLSLIGYHRVGHGCYELRWEQVKGKVDLAVTVQGPGEKGQKLSLYRWNKAKGSQAYTATLLCSFDSTFNMPTVKAGSTLAAATMMPMSLAVYEYTSGSDTGTMIVAGVGSAGVTPTGTFKDKWRYAAYFDCSDNRLKRGAYGVVTANSTGYLMSPSVAPIATPSSLTWKNLTLPKAGKSASGLSKDSAFPTLDFTSCQSELTDDWWALSGRNDVVNEGSLYGFKTADAWQTLELLATLDDGTSEVLKTYAFTNAWGSIKSTEEFGADLPLLWRVHDANFRLYTGGTLEDMRTDVIIDNVRVHQWRGRNEVVLYTGDDPDNANDSRTVNNADPDNFVYTSGWVQSPVSGKTALLLSAKRTIPGRPAGVRSPLMDGLSSRGSGIGNLEFKYRDCQTNTALLVQIATNIFRGDLAATTIDVSSNGVWRTVARLTYDELGSAGSTNIAFGIRNTMDAYGALARVILDPETVKAVESVTEESAFGSIELEYVNCQDEPPIDKGCWWGWNIRTLGDNQDSEKRMYLPDASEVPVGYSLALNNSTTEDVEKGKEEEYEKHMPFLQSPSFTNNNVIGEVSFRARKYDTSGYSQYAEVALYGIKSEQLARADDSTWTLLAKFIVSNTVFTTYSHRVSEDGDYAAIRLGVTGVPEVNPISRGPDPQCGDEPVRVLIDEVTICEAVTPELAVRNIGAFRYDMMSGAMASNVPSKDQQPLCREGWGVQCELYAVMLEDQIDTRHPPKVKLHWYEGCDLWGYDQWGHDAASHSGWLARATDTEALVYRSGYQNAPDAVIPQSVKEGGESPVVQYVLEVFYTVVDPKTGATTQKSKIVGDERGEWETPEWYAPVDYNTDRNYGKGEHWSCFCILDDVAPGWAWINEVNIYGGSDANGYNLDQNQQFVEIAAPAAADLSGWRLEMVQMFEYSKTTVTNTVAVFGNGGESPAGTKSVNEISNYVFHVIANPAISGSKYERTIFSGAGTLDGTWYFNTAGGYLFNKNHSLDDTEPVAIRLVRPNGIVEHQLVTIGENIWGDDDDLQEKCDFLNTYLKPATFFTPGEDSTAGDHSIGVINGQGELEDSARNNNWNNTMKRTPGMINEGQQINPEVPVPYGEMIYITSRLDQSGGFIEQSEDGGLTFTNATMRFFVRRGNQLGTNVVFRVEPWYEIASCIQTCNGVTTAFDVTGSFDRTARTLQVTLGRGCSNAVDVLTKACVDRQLAEYDVDENNPYTPAVIDWLQTGTDAYGNPFLNDDGIIRRAEFWTRACGEGKPGMKVGDLSLTEMYWLDIDPTAGDMRLVGGWGTNRIPAQKPVKDESGNNLSNDVMSVFLMITNATENVDYEGPTGYGKAWSPYVLRSIEPGATSWDYEEGTTSEWNSVTFKIKGILLNGHTSMDNPDNWGDLRWFVFHRDSFHQPGNALGAEPFTADIEILDPMHRHDSPGYEYGWFDYIQKPGVDPGMRPFYRWDINTRLKTSGIEVLRTNNVTAVTAP